MSSKKAIRIIKREQRELLANQQEAPEGELKTEKQTRREIFRTITFWVEQQKETKQEPRRLEESFVRSASTETVGV
jgi:hypothetical protein